MLESSGYDTMFRNQEQSVSLLVFSEMEAYPIYFGVAVLRLDFLCSY